MRRLTERARIAYEAARGAFLRLETAHEEGRRGFEENTEFLTKVAAFRQAAEAVHRAGAQLRT